MPAQNLQALVLQDAHSRAAFSEASEWARAAVNGTAVALAAGTTEEDIVGNGRKEESGRVDKNIQIGNFNFQFFQPICLMLTIMEGINGPIPGLRANACTFMFSLVLLLLPKEEAQ